jgi:hypothetical protein
LLGVFKAIDSNPARRHGFLKAGNMKSMKGTKGMKKNNC